MRPRVLVPGHRLPAGRAGRHEVVVAGERYLAAIRRAGANEWVIGPRPLDDAAAAELVAAADALVLLGGPDVDPALYGEPPHPRTYGVQREQDDFELAVLRAALAAELPTLAICRGCQLLNVACGGDLHQHLTDGEHLLSHAMPGFPAPEPGAVGPVHAVAVQAGTRLAAVVGAEVHGAHSHHQAVRRLGEGLRVTGTTADGVVEAVEHERGWVVGVQWHPEDTADADPVNQALFDALVARALAAR